MKPLIMPVFITGQGCQHQCVFCSGAVTAGPAEKVSPEALAEKVRLYASHKTAAVQIAFYGGNFTGLPVPEQEYLLSCARPLIDLGLVHSIRVSTRPDYITEENALLLKRGRVAVVELGAESLRDDVLTAARRGHTALDVARAVKILKGAGMGTGIHLMAGLPGDTREGFLESVAKTVMLRPEMVRVHPTIVFAGTQLAGLYEAGRYKPLSLSEAVGLCRTALISFRRAGIPVIRMGLQATPAMEREGAIVAGPFHPSFGLLVESSVFLEMAEGLIAGIPGIASGPDVTLTFFPGDESAVRGLKNSNTDRLADRARPARLMLKADGSQREGSLRVIAGSRREETCIDEFYGGVEFCSRQASQA